MFKKSFTNAAIIAVAAGVNTREFMNLVASDLIEEKLAQTTAEAEGCGDTQRGQPINYHGPKEFAPHLRQTLTPGMTLAQTQSGEAAPTPMQLNLAQVTAQARIKSPFKNKMAQQSSLTHTCTTAMQRNRNTFDDYLSIQAGSEAYTDINFPTNDALFWADAGEAGRDMSQLVSYIDWKRISGGDSDFDGKTFFGPNGISSVNPQDINQGYIGNCWIMASVSAMAEIPGRIDSFFVTNELSDNGIYAVQMYTLGVPFTQIVDDYLPMNNNGDTPIFANFGKDDSLWGAITEKAFAKRYGNYEHTVGGWMYASVSAINGSPYKIFNHGELSDDQLWNLIKSHDQDSDILTAASHFCGNHDQSNEEGVACSHAYTTIGCMELETTEGTVKLIKVRNPWGSEQYSGDWSDNSDKWTDAYRAAVEAELGDAGASNQGIFYMDLASYKHNFQLSVVNQDTRGWDFDYFLMLDDETSGEHTITVTNTGEAQDIYVGAHVWQDRTYGWYNPSCQQAMWSSTKHSLSGNGSTLYFDADTGAAWTDTIRFEAGETKEFTANFDWSRLNVAKDWSVTAWGTSGEVVVRNKNTAIVTDHMPQYTDDKSGLNPPEPIVPDEDEELPDPYENCEDIDNGHGDSYGDKCAAYASNPGWCGGYDTEQFNSGEQCCVCGGGNRTDPDEGDEEEEEEEDVDPAPIPDEDDEEEEEDTDPVPEPDEGECQDLDNNGEFQDSYGDACAAYHGNPGWCGGYDDEDFNSMTMCCACGGGETGGDGDEEDDVTPIPDEDEDEEDDITPIPDEDDIIPDEDEDEEDGVIPDEDGTIPTVEELMMEFDLDGNGELSLEEFAELFAKYCETCPFSSAQELFNLVNEGGDTLNMEELEKAYALITDPDDDDDEPTPAPEPVPVPMPDMDFDAWVIDQKIPETDYYCYLEIHNEWHNGYNLFAGHDCEIYDLTLTVMARRNDWDNHFQAASSDAQPLGCEDIGTFDRACKYILHPTNNKLGIRFDADADVDLWYETEWANCVEEATE